jgi:hypothetical protein
MRNLPLKSMHQVSFGATVFANGCVAGGARKRFRFGRHRPRRLRILPMELVLGHSCSGYRSTKSARSLRGPHFGWYLRACTTRSSSSAEMAFGLVRGRRDLSSTARTS